MQKKKITNGKNRKGKKKQGAKERKCYIKVFFGIERRSELTVRNEAGNHVRIEV